MIQFSSIKAIFFLFSSVLSLDLFLWWRTLAWKSNKELWVEGVKLSDITQDKLKYCVACEMFLLLHLVHYRLILCVFTVCAILHTAVFLQVHLCMFFTRLFCFMTSCSRYYCRFKGCCSNLLFVVFVFARVVNRLIKYQCLNLENVRKSNAAVLLS